MANVRYYNQSAPFWDFVASLEQQGQQFSHPWFGAQQRRDPPNNDNEETNEGQDPFDGHWGWGRGRGGHHRGGPHGPRGGRHSHGPPHHGLGGEHHHPPPPPLEHERPGSPGHGGPPPPPEGHEHHGPPPSDPHGPHSPPHHGPGRHHGPGPHHGPGSHHGFPHGPHGPRGGFGCGRRGRHGGPRGFGGFGGPNGFLGAANGFGLGALAELFQQQLFPQTSDNNNYENKDAAAGDDDDKTMKGDEDFGFTPEADVFDTENAFIVHISLPGAKKEDVGVNWDAEKSELSVAGVVYRPGDEEFLKNLALDERKVGAFERKVRLGSRANPAQVDTDGISAKLEDGVLRVTVPKEDKEWTEIKKVDIE